MIRRRWLEPGLLGMVAAVAGVQACGGSDDRSPRLGGGTSGVSGRGGVAGVSGVGGAGTGGSGGAIDPLAPTVVITNPVALSDPNAASADNPVLTSPDPVKVVCEVVASKAPGALAISPESVTLELLDAKLEPVGDKPVATKQTSDKEYSAEFVLTEIPNGIVGFRCNASDISAQPKSNSDTIATFVDHGPRIVPQSPLAKEAKALGLVDFRFDVTPLPLAEGDQGAAITGVTFSVAGKSNFVAQEVPGSPGSYFVPVDFRDPQFDPKPQGSVPVTITATNSRTPQPITTTFPYTFTVDGKGPSIAVVSPPIFKVVGGTVELTFTVDDGVDGSGVNEGTIEVRLNNDPRKFDATKSTIWGRNGNTYSYKFDSREIRDTVQTGDTVQISVNIVANDIVGNEGRGQDHTLYLDNYPPIVDLDPENVREIDRSGTSTFCSLSFDPVGTQAANDMAPVRSFARFRTIAWEQTNTAPGQTTFYPAGVDENQVYLYLQPDPTKPLLIDTNQDGLCDEIATTPDFRKLDKVAPAGEAWYATDTAGNTGPPALSPPPTCTQKALLEPKHLCALESSDLTRVIKFDSVGAEPVIYAQDVVAGANQVTCTGGQWQIGSLPVVKEGWLCLAVRAMDRALNVGISPPLRVCFNDDNPANGVPDCSSPPSCAQPIPGQQRDCVYPPKFTSRYVRKL